MAEYRAKVLRIDHAAIATTVVALTGAGARVAAPAGLPTEWVAGMDVVLDTLEKNPLAVTDLDGIDAVVTGCAVGIAATGTIVLDAGPTQGGAR